MVEFYLRISSPSLSPECHIPAKTALASASKYSDDDTAALNVDLCTLLMPIAS